MAPDLWSKCVREPFNKKKPINFGFCPKFQDPPPPYCHFGHYFDFWRAFWPILTAFCPLLKDQKIKIEVRIGGDPLPPGSDKIRSLWGFFLWKVPLYSRVQYNRVQYSTIFVRINKIINYSELKNTFQPTFYYKSVNSKGCFQAILKLSKKIP